ncbi:hypothetical protein D3C75_622710 [compost metagenome]
MRHLVVQRTQAVGQGGDLLLRLGQLRLHLLLVILFELQDAQLELGDLVVGAADIGHALRPLGVQVGGAALQFEHAVARDVALGSEVAHAVQLLSEEADLRAACRLHLAQPLELLLGAVDVLAQDAGLAGQGRTAGGEQALLQSGRLL